MNAADKASRSGKQQQEQNLPNLGPAFKPSPVNVSKCHCTISMPVSIVFLSVRTPVKRLGNHTTHWAGRLTDYLTRPTPVALSLSRTTEHRSVRRKGNKREKESTKENCARGEESATSTRQGGRAPCAVHHRTEMIQDKQDEAGDLGTRHSHCTDAPLGLTH